MRAARVPCLAGWVTSWRCVASAVAPQGPSPASKSPRHTTSPRAGAAREIRTQPSARPRTARSIRDFGPGARLVALQDRLADGDLVVAVLEGGEGRLALAASGDVRVHLHEQVVRPLGVALGVAAGVVGEGTNLGGDQRAVLDHRLVGPLAAPGPEAVALLLLPFERALGAVALA